MEGYELDDEGPTLNKALHYILRTYIERNKLHEVIL